MARAVVHDQLLGIVSRITREEIRVSVRTVGTVKWLDLRIWYQSDTGEMKPSQRGMSLSPKEWAQLKQSLARLKAQHGGVDAV